MNAERELLEARLEKFTKQLKGLHSFIKELNEETVGRNTPKEAFADDMMIATHNASYYESEIARLNQQIAKEADHAAYFVYEDSSRQWRWQFRAANNRIIADSGQGYHNKQDCLHALSLVKGSKEAPVHERHPGK